MLRVEFYEFRVWQFKITIEELVYWLHQSRYFQNFLNKFGLFFHCHALMPDLLLKLKFHFSSKLLHSYVLQRM